ncbi:MAG TPA: hypothetical protein VGM27_10555, partial [Acidobacteriaceae bacterium]
DNIHAFPPQPLNGASFGNSFGVSFYLRYTPETTLFRRKDNFEDTPKLEWLETITMKESGGELNGIPRTPQFWKFHADMYRHNPSSGTLIAWRKRYLLAYKHVANEPDTSPSKSFVQMMAAGSGMITLDELGGLQQDDVSKAEAVRNYISKNGCQMIIHLHDVPAIFTSNDFRSKERLLEFDIGVQGQQARIKAYQYLNINRGLPAGQWAREFEFSSNVPHNLQPGGHGMAPPPVLVSNPRNALPFSGEYD